MGTTRIIADPVAYFNHCDLFAVPEKDDIDYDAKYYGFDWTAYSSTTQFGFENEIGHRFYSV